MRSIAVLAIAGSCGSFASAQQINDRATLNSLLGLNKTEDNFETFSVAYNGALVLEVSTLDANTVTNGQGPGLVNPGATYSSMNGRELQWNGDAYYGLQTKTILANDTGLGVAYSGFVQAAGFDVHAFNGFGYDGEAVFYDANHVQIGSIPFHLSNGGAETVFIGWQHTDGISYVSFTSYTHGWSPIIDNHAYGLTGPSLRADGNCPGSMRFTVTGATPGGWVGYGYGYASGQTKVPGCPGVYVDIKSAQKAGQAQADAGGRAILSGKAPQAACGRVIVQAVDLDTCRTTNVIGI